MASPVCDGRVLTEDQQGCVLQGRHAAAHEIHGAAATADVLAMSRTRAVEWAGSGVRINRLARGLIETDRDREVLPVDGGPWLGTRIYGDAHE